ncbi:MAG TPA: indole-3-glycerol phosphate synthase TrpC [Pyrinomonadaceae bacterium]|nr:indole-3-glycerol phosphate synthase TrpC [Pyrinomonadaceae bacterium]
MDILSQIIKRKRLRLEDAKRANPIAGLRQLAADVRSKETPHALLSVLTSNHEINIIAEFKRCSPSKGTIRENAEVGTIAREYETAGARAISVVTEQDFFAGSLDDLCAARAVVSIPILRKDFIVEEYQVFESASAGADALLLIVGALDDDTLARLLRLTEHELGMDALVEVHNETELERALAQGAKLIGVNNRDLRTFGVSTDTSRRLAKLAPPDVVLVSESGLTPDEVRGLSSAGYRGFLVGEALMRAPDPAAALREFLLGNYDARAVWREKC